MANTTFSGPVISQNGFVGSVTGAVSGLVTLTPYTVAGVPTAAGKTGAMVYVSNGAAGSPVVAFSNGTNWLRVDTLAAISAS